jgi:SAM-dependent methyltransferase
MSRAKSTREGGDDRFMGRWSRALATRFVPFVGVRGGDAILDVGSGTGALAAAVAAAAPSSRITGVDAEQLRFVDGRFDRTLALLALNFVADPVRALDEMVRVTRRGGTVAAAVWDYGRHMEMLRTFWDEAAALNPAAGTRDERHMPLCRSGELGALWRDRRMAETCEAAITIHTCFSSFEDYWSPFLEGEGPAGAYVATLAPDERDALRLRLRRRLLGEGPDGPIGLDARAWVVRGRRTSRTRSGSALMPRRQALAGTPTPPLVPEARRP